MKEAISKDNDKALIDEAETGEDAAMKAYQHALGASLPANVLNVVQKQYSGVQEAHSAIRDLKHNWTGSAGTATV